MTDAVPRFTRPNIVSFMEFEGADFFALEGSEEVSDTDREAALGNMLDQSELALCGDAEKYLETMTLFMSVTAYRRMPVDDFYRKGWPEGLADYLREGFSEEHADESGDDRLSDADAAELLTRMQDTVNWYLGRVKVFQCESARIWRFDNDDLLELVQQLRPEWLERKTP